MKKQKTQNRILSPYIFQHVYYIKLIEGKHCLKSCTNIGSSHFQRPFLLEHVHQLSFEIFHASFGHLYQEWEPQQVTSSFMADAKR